MHGMNIKITSKGSLKNGIKRIYRVIKKVSVHLMITIQKVTSNV
jgi:hypothetical protein